MAMSQKTSRKLRKMKEVLEWFLIEVDARCFFCKEQVVDVMKVTIHHVDRDRSNNAPSNLVLSHATCHKSFHMKVRIGEHEGGKLANPKK